MRQHASEILDTIRELVSSNSSVRDSLMACVKKGIKGSAVDGWAIDSTVERVMEELFPLVILANGLTTHQHEEILRLLIAERSVFKPETETFQKLSGIIDAFVTSGTKKP